MSKITKSVVNGVVKNLILPGDDYRLVIVNLLDTQFLEHTISFFKKVAEAKIENIDINIDWYRENFVDESLSKKDIALNAGINIKTINNMYGSTKREVVVCTANKHYENLKNLVEQLIDEENGVNVTLAIKIGKVSVELNINESLIVINALSVHRASMRGGIWSSIGKRAEKILMLTLCKLYSVEKKNWSVIQKKEDGHGTFDREIDFFLVKDKQRYKCEVKLMGKGNPEVADSAFARHSQIFVADTLSHTNIKQFESRNVHWVALKHPAGYKNFEKILTSLDIPHKKFDGNLEQEVDNILSNIDDFD